MKIHEFGNSDSPKILLLHCACMTWEMFEYAAKELSKSHHVIIPAMPGYDFENESEYTSVEQIAADIEAWLLEKGYFAIDILYGLSMGGSIAIREYWYGEYEKKARKQDLEYVENKFFSVKFKEYQNMDHAELAAIRIEELVKALIA